MYWDSAYERELMKVRALLLAMLAAFVFLGVALWRVQVLDATKYRTSLDKQSMRRVRLPGMRGRILDRHGVCLADNRPSYCIAVYVEELRRPGPWSNTVNQVEAELNRLSSILNLKRLTTRDDIYAHIRKRLPLPLIAWRDVTPETLARWAEHNADFRGADIYVEPVRDYTHGRAAAHLLGYVGRSQPDRDEDDPYHFYLPQMDGKGGVEKHYNNELSGVAGGYLIRVDASGFRYNKTREVAPQPGQDVRLTLDANVQTFAERAIAGTRGAAVVLDPRNGDLLAMASAPTFDPNAFVPAIPAAEWKRLLADPDRPLLNRAICGIYPPGSIFKPVVAIAALEAGAAQPDTEFDCPGFFALGPIRFACWQAAGHGTLHMRKAIEQSCNSYFCQLGLKVEHPRIVETARSLGLGRPTGIELDYESSGLLPSAAWKMNALHEGWRPGDTCNLSIGQGAICATPLQMACVVSAIANNGALFRPRMVAPNGKGGDLIRRLPWSQRTLDTVRGGMFDVVQSDDGTGKRARIAMAELGGKTGTAEYGPRSERRKYAWMVAFAPFHAPRYAVALVVEDAVSGGLSAAPRMRALMEGIFGAGSAPPQTPPPATPATTPENGHQDA